MMRKIVSFVTLSLSLPLWGWAQVPNPPNTPPREGIEQAAPGTTPAGARELTAADVEAFLDGILPLQLEQEDIAGATVAVVKDGRLLFAKGYGYADAGEKTPVSVGETLFRPGSVSKLFIWTAVMQLFEQGRLDLDRDVNDYLDFEIPEAYGKPITLKHLLTHTPGFEEQIKDLFKENGEVPPLGEYVKTHLPRRIFPPGTTPAYSNYGTALAGYIVERVSGRPLLDYINENILKPLGMAHSTFAQPLPAALAPHMSGGYRLASQGAKPFEMIGAWPAGSLSSTATDMARFMGAHLQGGQLDGARILKPETVSLMHSRLFALDPAANAMAYGFYEESRNGHRIIGHAGDTVYFPSDLHLIPDARLGFFISYNSAGRSLTSPRTVLWQAFLDRYLPYTPPPATPPASAKEDAEAVSGMYRLSRRSETSFLKAFYLVQAMTVSAVEDGLIETPELKGTNGQPKKWRAIAPLTFREVNGQDTLIFKPGEDGLMQLVLPYPFFVGQRAGLGENPRVLLTVLGVSLAIMVLTLVLWPVAAIIRRYYGRRLELTRGELWLRIAVRVVFALDVIFVAGLFGLVLYGLENLWVFSDRGNTWINLVQVIGVVGAVGTLLVLYQAVRAWRDRGKSIWAKLRATTLVLACLGFLWFAFVGNLFHFSSNY